MTQRRNARLLPSIVLGWVFICISFLADVRTASSGSSLPTIAAAELSCVDQTVSLHGSFPRADGLFVLLDVGFGPEELPIVGASPELLVANLPHGCEPSGTFRLSVGEERAWRKDGTIHPVFQTFASIDITFGAVGVEGPAGRDGVDGRDGQDGQDGVDGASGAPGAPGASCWDTNANAVCDPAVEDISGDGTCTVADCVGPQGQPGNLALAGQKCPARQFVTGFDPSGDILCASFDDGDDGSTELPEAAQAVEAFFEALIGNEAGAEPAPFELGAPGTGASLEGSFEFLGYALCSPTNPLAPPNPFPGPSSPLYDCTPDANVSITLANGGTEVEISVVVDAVFADGTGDWRAFVLGLPVGSGMIDAYAVLSDVRMTAVAPLIDTGAGTKRIGPVQVTAFSFGNTEIEVELGGLVSDLADLAADLGDGFIAFVVLQVVRDTLGSALGDAVAALPELSI